MKVVIKGKGKNMIEKLEVPEKIGCKLIVMKVKFSFYMTIIIYHLPHPFGMKIPNWPWR